MRKILLALMCFGTMFLTSCSTDENTSFTESSNFKGSSLRDKELTENHALAKIWINSHPEFTSVDSVNIVKTYPKPAATLKVKPYHTQNQHASGVSGENVNYGILQDGDCYFYAAWHSPIGQNSVVVSHSVDYEANGYGCHTYAWALFHSIID